MFRVFGMYTSWNYLFILSSWYLRNRTWSGIVGANTVLIALMVTFSNTITKWDCVREFYGDLLYANMPRWFWVMFDTIGHVLPLLVVTIPERPMPYVMAWCGLTAWYLMFRTYINHFYRPFTKEMADSSYAFTTLCVLILVAVLAP
jgi:hypothetical protein